MRGSFWNSDGFGDPAKHLAVNDMIREHKLDFLAILETGRPSFAPQLLSHLSGGFDYVWFCLPPQGRSGDILVGFNSTIFKIKNVIAGDSCVKFHVVSKSDGFEWALVAAYGAAQAVAEDGKKLRSGEF